ncbi:flavin reductase family protein [Streptomyces xylophagus]|uniref:flavin reductase family protein n=1 Tax=Streptomyces xylophagus TaxID=285514 RepID=UPI0005BD44A7|nr:flavin reductase family protein [Streptomyces xylophagus]
MTRVEPADFREFFGSIPTAVAVVTTVDSHGRPQGFTCNAFAAVSPQPPLLLVCVDGRSRSLPSLLSWRAFVLHLLADDGEETARVFASRAVDKFVGLPWFPSEVVREVPVLDRGVLAYAECTLDRVVEAGDHHVLIGRMEAVHLHPRRPVLYQRGTFRSWGGTAEKTVQA